MNLQSDFWMVLSATDLLTFQTNDIYKMDPPRVKELIEQKKPAREANKNKLERWQDETVWVAASQLLTEQWDMDACPARHGPVTLPAPALRHPGQAARRGAGLSLWTLHTRHPHHSFPSPLPLLKM